MRPLIIVIFTIALSIQLSAQSFGSLQSNGLLSDENRLFTDDNKSQLLFNPARGANAEHSFVFVNKNKEENRLVYYDYYFGYPEYWVGDYQLQNQINDENDKSNYRGSSKLSAGWFIKSETPEKFSYLIQIEQQSGITTDDKNEFLNEKIEQTGYKRFSEQNLDRNTSIKNHFAQAKFSVIYGAKNDGQSFSIIAGMRSQSTSSLLDYLSVYRSNQSDQYKHYNKLQIGQKNTNDDRIWQLGLEAALSGETSDFIFSLSFENEMNKGLLNGSYYGRSVDSSNYSNTWQLSGSESRSNQNITVENNPLHFNLNLFYSKRFSGLTKDDNFYGSLKISRTKNDNRHLLEMNSYSKTQNNPEIQTIQTAETVQDNSYNSRISFKSGYIVKHNTDDLFLLTGLNVSYSQIQAEYLSHYLTSGYNFPEKASGVWKEPSISVPIYGKYSINQWISVFGGINYSYYYSIFELKYDPKDLNIVNPSTVNEVKYGKSTTSTRKNETQETYLGVVLKHNSGFEIQTFTDYDFSYVKNWQMSVIYNF